MISEIKLDWKISASATSLSKNIRNSQLLDHWKIVNYIRPMLWEEPKQVVYERFLQPLVRNLILHAKISANQ